MYPSSSTSNFQDNTSPNLDRSRSSLRSSFSASNLGNWAAESPPFGQPQYVPGYLLSATGSVGGPSYPTPPLVPEPVTGRRGVSSNTKFGADPFASSFRTTTNVRSKAVAPDPDDENAPPSNSILEGINTPETRKNLRTSVAGGFHSSTPSSSHHQQATHTPVTNGTSTSSSTIVIFGFSPEFYSEIVELFKSIGETSAVEPPPLDRNWISISYKNSWEAARAVRRNGEVLALSGSNVMIGVKWADPTVNNDAAAAPGTPAMDTPSRTGGSFGMSIGRPITYAPSSSAFKAPQSSSYVSAARTKDWGSPVLRTATDGKADGPTAGSGIFGKLTELVFGW